MFALFIGIFLVIPAVLCAIGMDRRLGGAGPLLAIFVFLTAVSGGLSAGIAFTDIRAWLAIPLAVLVIPITFLAYQAIDTKSGMVLRTFGSILCTAGTTFFFTWYFIM
ncbi:hypothetical protein ACFL26_01750 [Patescibacteria group bacterium]